MQLILGRSVADEIREDMGGRPAAVTVADWSMLEAQLIRSFSAGEAETGKLQTEDPDRTVLSQREEREVAWQTGKLKLL